MPAKIDYCLSEVRLGSTLKVVRIMLDCTMKLFRNVASTVVSLVKSYSKESILVLAY